MLIKATKDEALLLCLVAFLLFNLLSEYGYNGRGSGINQRCL